MHRISGMGMRWFSSSEMWSVASVKMRKRFRKHATRLLNENWWVLKTEDVPMSSGQQAASRLWRVLRTYRPHFPPFTDPTQTRIRPLRTASADALKYGRTRPRNRCDARRRVMCRRSTRSLTEFLICVVARLDDAVGVGQQDVTGAQFDTSRPEGRVGRHAEQHAPFRK